MIAIPFAILALAAGVYLLIQVRVSGLGSMYRNLSWLVILLSLLCMAGAGARGVMHWRHHRQEASMHCDMGQGMGASGAACPYMKGGDCCKKDADCCTKNADCSMDGKGGMHGSAMSGCCMDGGKAAMGHCDMKGDGAMPACCAKDAKAPADSSSKK